MTPILIVEKGSGAGGTGRVWRVNADLAFPRKAASWQPAIRRRSPTMGHLAGKARAGVRGKREVTKAKKPFGGVIGLCGTRTRSSR